LQSLDLSGGLSGGGNGVGDGAFNYLAAHPELAKSLKLMKFAVTMNKDFMRSMKALTKARAKMQVVLVTQHQIKKWGDWELETYEEHFKKGRRYEPPFDHELHNPYY
jgi:hypothetical protein